MAAYDAERALLRECARILSAFDSSQTALQDALAPLEEAALDVTVLGQTKAGKTALVNALAGRPGLLPTDVNPWTSVVTAVHLGRSGPDGIAAEFEFYDEAGWRALAEGAGRASAVAMRSGGEEAVETVRRQLEELQARARSRLGARFELLLGGRHRLAEIDAEKLGRYVVFGAHEADPTGDAPAASAPSDSGKYAELTRRADIWLPEAGWGLTATLRDTPGVNDPLLVREQATLEALEEADLALLTLSASQALSVADLGILRALAALGGARVVIFVNRIDDLSDPVPQCAEIERGVRATLEAAGLGRDAPVLFGSAAWAAADQSGAGEAALPPASRAAFQALCAARPGATLRDASGMRALRTLLTGMARGGRGLRNMRAASGALSNMIATRRAALGPVAATAPEDRADALLTAMQKQAAALDQLIESSAGPAFARMERAVQEHAEAEAERVRQEATARRGGTVTADLQPLRRRLAAQHDEFAGRVELALTARLDRFAREVERIAAPGPDHAPLRITPPEPPRSRAPAALARTVSFDLGESWWRGWFSAGARADRRAAEMRRLIEEEMAPILEELRRARMERYAQEASLSLRRFFADCIDLALPPGDGARRDAAAMERLAEAQALVDRARDGLAQDDAPSGDERLSA